MAGPPSKVNPITGIFYRGSMLFLLLAIAFGAAFISTSGSSNFFTWVMDTCIVYKTVVNSEKWEHTITLKADIGWRKFTTWVDPTGEECFRDLATGAFETGESYPLGDYEDNHAAGAGYGMVATWVAGMVVALVTVVTMFAVSIGRRQAPFSMKTLSFWCSVFSIGLITATTVFWWTVEGKFGKREEALVYQLPDYVMLAAAACADDNSSMPECKGAIGLDWHMDAPGSSLALGITSMFFYTFASYLLYMRAARTDALLNGAEETEPEPTEVVKQIVGDMVGGANSQTDDNARVKAARSARTGVRAGARAPSSTVSDDAQGVEHGDPMTYALEEGAEEVGSQDEAEDEVVYQNHQVHPSIVNHSMPNQTQTHTDDTMSRQSEAMSRVSPAHLATAPAGRQYTRGYSRATSGASYTTGGHSFETPSDADFSDTASSAQYYGGHHRGGSRSFMSAGSRGDSFDEYSQR